MPLEDACREAARLGCKGFDLIGPGDWPVLRKYGLGPEDLNFTGYLAHDTRPLRGMIRLRR
jgi:hydroxypyruvate isomerase